MKDEAYELSLAHYEAYGNATVEVLSEPLPLSYVSCSET